jgi:HAD domain in Swiss Army Knife RNA repair proteins
MRVLERVPCPPFVEPKDPDSQADEAPLAAAKIAQRDDGSAPVRPLLMVDVDGVISLFAEGWPEAEGSLHSIEGIPHFLSSAAAAHLLDLAADFELVWASGWEERADEHLPHLLGLPAGLPFLRFDRAVGRSHAHWKLEAIEAYAGGRPLAWLDDSLDDACRRWARERPAPTLLVETLPERGLTGEEVRLLKGWARSLAPV